MYINYTFYLNNSVTFCSPPPVPVLPLLTVGTPFLEYVLLINTEKPQGVILFFLNCFYQGAFKPYGRSIQPAGTLQRL